MIFKHKSHLLLLLILLFYDIKILWSVSSFCSGLRVQELASPPVNEPMVVGIDQSGITIELPREAFQRAGQTGMQSEVGGY